MVIQKMLSRRISLTECKKNRFGNVQYMKAEDGKVLIEALPNDEIWSIMINDSDSDVIEWLNENMSGWKLYECSSGKFALSPKASKVIQPEGFGQGAAIIIRFYDDSKGDAWYLFVVDNKIYL